MTALERLEETLQAIRKIAETNTVPDTTADDDLDEAEYGDAGIGGKPGTFQACPGGSRSDRIRNAARRRKVGGWSDSCLAAAEGVPVVCAMGVKGANNHSMEEYAVVDTLFSRAKLALASIITL